MQGKGNNITQTKSEKKNSNIILISRAITLQCYCKLVNLSSMHNAHMRHLKPEQIILSVE